MNKQLTFKLEHPIEELIPAMIGFNNEELLNKAQELAEQYSSAVYTEEMISQAKEDRARLNALIKAINDERIRIGKVYNEPYNVFKSKVDEVLACLQKPANLIGEQLSAYEAERKARKRADIENYFNSTIGELATFVSFEKIFNEKWLNASASMKSITSEIDKTVEGIWSGLMTIEALNSEDETTLKAYFFRTLDLGHTLLENERLKAEKKRIEEAKAQAAAKAAEAEAARKKEDACKKPVDEPQENATIREKLYDVTLAFSGLTKAQAMELMSYIEEKHLKYTRIK